jgi:salicylate 5-hydroxylase small subunit
MIATRVSVEDRLAIEDPYAQYVAILDQRRYEEWPDLFIEACSYRLVPRENDDRGLPLATLAFESRGMLRDRVYGVTQTLFHEPYYQRHLITNFIVRPADDGFTVEANYLVLRTKAGALTEILSTGRCRDRIVPTPEGLRFAERTIVFDSETIPNSIIYPL